MTNSEFVSLVEKHGVINAPMINEELAGMSRFHHVLEMLETEEISWQCETCHDLFLARGIWRDIENDMMGVVYVPNSLIG